MSAVENLTAEVAGIETVVGSAEVAFQKIAAEMKQQSTDPAIQALADRLHAASTLLARAVAANTAAADESPATDKTT